MDTRKGEDRGTTKQTVSKKRKSNEDGSTKMVDRLAAGIIKHKGGGTVC